jgi:hypothetical protein
MSPPPPPLPTRSNNRTLKFVLAGLGTSLLIGVACLVLLIRYITSSGITRPIDNIFGDQHLKTTVALVELHKLRYGRYPKSLRELRFAGNWDQLALNSVAYYTNPEGTAYYVEVERGWAGKPTLDMPAEFWKGTGYSPALKPKAK